MWIIDNFNHCRRWVADSTIARWHKWAIGHPHFHAIITQPQTYLPVCARVGTIAVGGAVPILPAAPFVPFIPAVPLAGYAAPYGEVLPDFGGVGAFGGGGVGAFGGGGVGVLNAGFANTGNAAVNNAISTSTLPIIFNLPQTEQMSVADMSPGIIPANTLPIGPMPIEMPTTQAPVNTPEGASWVFLATGIFFCWRRK